jgi:hypothetical protein
MASLRATLRSFGVEHPPRCRELGCSCRLPCGRTVLVSRAGFLFLERPCSVAGRGLFPSRSARRRGAVPSLEMAACSRAVAGRSPEENRETIDGAIPRALRAQASLISVAAGYFLTVPPPLRHLHLDGGRGPPVTSTSGSLDIRGLWPHDGVLKRALGRYCGLPSFYLIGAGFVKRQLSSTRCGPWPLRDKLCSFGCACRAR